MRRRYERRCFKYDFVEIFQREDSTLGSCHGCLSNSEYSSPSSSANAVSKNHLFFLMKCTTTVPPTRLLSYRFFRPSRCVQAYSGVIGLPKERVSMSNEREDLKKYKPSRIMDISLPSTSASTPCDVVKSGTGGVYVTPNVDTLE